MPKLQAISETSLYADDLDRAIDFYSRILGLRQISSMNERGVVFRVNAEQVLIIFDPAVTRADDSVVPSHGCEGAGHAAFSIEPSALAEWRQSLIDNKVIIEREVDWPRGGRSIYFRDPAGNSIELVAGPLWPD